MDDMKTKYQRGGAPQTILAHLPVAKTPQPCRGGSRTALATIGPKHPVDDNGPRHALGIGPDPV